MLQPWHDETTSALPIDAAFFKEIVERARVGDQTAFDVIYWYWSKPIWHRLLRLVHSKEVAEDLHQEVWKKVWENLPTLNSEAPFHRWVYSVAAHAAFDYLRHAKKYEFLPLPEEETGEYATIEFLSIKSMEEQVCETICIEQTLAQISERSRVCILLCDQWGFKYHEVAELLDISIDTVGAYISRGRQRFCKLYRGTTIVASPVSVKEGELKK